MQRHRLQMSLLLGIAFLMPPSALAQAPSDYGTIKGQVVWGGRRIPQRTELKIPANRTDIFERNPTANPLKGTILDERLLVDTLSRGIKNAYVWLLPADGKSRLPVARRLRYVSSDPVVVSSFAGMFLPHACAMREGQTLVFHNVSPVGIDFRLMTDSIKNQDTHVLVKSRGTYEMSALRAQRFPLLLSSGIQQWMTAVVIVFDHPYFAMTDENGRFEMKHAPVGDFRIMIYHDQIGYRVGKTGEPITVKAGVNDLGSLPTSN
jgi:hypothetical protein